MDSSNALSQPFVKIINLADSTESISGITGLYKAKPGDQLSFEHFLYEPKTITVKENDTVQYIFLEPRKLDQLDLSQDSIGNRIFQQFQDTMLVKGYPYVPYLKFETINDLHLYSKRKSKANIQDLDGWKEYLSLFSLEENISQGPRKSKLRVVYSKTVTPDSTFTNNDNNTLVPSLLHLISPLNEYIRINELEYFNPLHRRAHRRYKYHYLGQISFGENELDVVLSLPEKNKNFASINALLFFDSKTKHLKGSVYRPAKSISPWQLNSDYLNLPNMTGMQNNVYFEIFLKKIPRNVTDTRAYFYSTKNNFQFNPDSAKVRKNDLQIFQSRKDSIQNVQDEFYDIEPVQEYEKLQYLKVDSSESKFVNRKWYDLVVNIALQNIGLKVGRGYFNNIFKINAYETLRIGVGYQSRNVISDRLKFGGYFGYAINPDGISDQGFRFGFNAGMYLGKGKKQFIDYNYKNDVLEPGRTFYLYEKKDLIRNFFTSRIGLTVSNDISYTSTINKNFVFKVNFNNYSFDPQFYYWYHTSPEDSTDFFRFSEVGFKIRVGKYSTMNGSLKRLLSLKSKVIPAFYFNYVQGFDNILNGQYSYRRFNFKAKSYFQFNEMYHLDLTAETGLATKEIPYPVLYVGAGNISELASIMVQDAFQTMDLYDYLTDKYVNVFTTFYVNFKTSKKNRMRPQVGFAWNMGWGNLNGNPNVHSFAEDEGVTDYRNGFYETGILFTNFLQARLLGMLRGEFGLGAFYNVGQTTSNRLAFRVTYKITTL
jgi:hypothetical protein